MSKELIDHDTVNRLVAMMESKMGSAMPAKRADLRVVRPMSAQELATEAWQWAQQHTPTADYMDVDQSPRARDIREINRIALRHGWGRAVSDAVDRAKAGGLSDMRDDDLAALVQHMHHLVDCAETGCEPGEYLPAW